MIQAGFRRILSPQYRASFRQPIVVLCLLLLCSGSSTATENQDGYFYAKQASGGSYGTLCSDILDTLVATKDKSAIKPPKGIVSTLRYMNVDYLLEDYDDSLRAGRSKKYLTFADLQSEVQENKREIYCRIELANYMKHNPAFAGAIYQKLLAAALKKIETTYVSATESFRNQNFTRAMYAFDLIAPYHDSYTLYVKSAEAQQALLAEQALLTAAETIPKIATLDNRSLSATTAVGPIEVSVAAGLLTTTSAGLITLAANDRLTDDAQSSAGTTGPIATAVKGVSLAKFRVGPIAMAAMTGPNTLIDKPGPISAAASAVE